jgi:hypothetical protein
MTSKITPIDFKIHTGGKISAKIDWPATIKYVPVKPARMRIAVNIAILIDSAAPIEQRQRNRIAILYAHLRPINLPIGIQTREENPIASKTPALVAAIFSLVVENSSEISGSAVRNAVLKKVITKVIQLTVNRITYRRHLGSLKDGLSSVFPAGACCLSGSTMERTSFVSVVLSPLRLVDEGV